MTCDPAPALLPCVSAAAQEIPLPEMAGSEIPVGETTTTAYLIKVLR